MTSFLPYFSTRAADDLSAAVAENLERYVSGDFSAFLAKPGNSLTIPVDVDLDALSALSFEQVPEADYKNALIVWGAFRRLTPNLACENRVWTRICHGEALPYARGRWLTGLEGDKLIKAIQIHLFATTQTMCRDDNAISRLWWSAFAAHRADPGDFETSLRLILKTADIRSNFIERPWISSRRSVASALLRKMKSEPWLTEKEINFRETMKALNVDGAGIAFEVLPETKANEVIDLAVEHAMTAVGSFQA